MSLLRDLVSPRARLLRQAREIRSLRRELKAVKLQNDSMRAGMRRCMTCDYRTGVRRRQAATLEQQPTPENVKE